MISKTFSKIVLVKRDIQDKFCNVLHLLKYMIFLNLYVLGK